MACSFGPTFILPDCVLHTVWAFWMEQATFGICLAPKIFEQRMRKLIKERQGVKVVADDLQDGEHWERS